MLAMCAAMSQDVRFTEWICILSGEDGMHDEGLAITQLFLGVPFVVRGMLKLQGGETKLVAGLKVLPKQGTNPHPKNCATAQPNRK